MARRKKPAPSKYLMLGTLERGTYCKTPDDAGIEGRKFRVVHVSPGAVRVQQLDRTRDVVIEGETKAKNIPTYSNIAFSTMVELFTPEEADRPKLGRKKKQ